MPRRSEVTLTGAIAIGIGGMVGGGIFAVLGVAAEQASGTTPIAFAVAGAIAALTAYSYSKLSVRYPSAGGTVTFIDRIFGVEPLTGGVNIVLWAGYIATTGLYAAAFGHYAATLLPGNAETSALAFKSLAVLGILVPWIINLANAGLIARTERAVVALKLVILLGGGCCGDPCGNHRSRLDPSSWSSHVDRRRRHADLRRLRGVRADRQLLGRGPGSVTHVAEGVHVEQRDRRGPVRLDLSRRRRLAHTRRDPSVRRLRSGRGGRSIARGRRIHHGRAVGGPRNILPAINATLYGTSRLSFTLATEGELPPEFERREWNQPIGLHITTVLGLAITIGLPLESISSLSSSIFLIVFAVVNLAAYRADHTTGVRRPISLAVFLGCVSSFVVLTAHNVRGDRRALVVLVALLSCALVGETLILRRRRQAQHHSTV